MGLDVLCDGRRAFVNCTRDTLIKGLVTLASADIPPSSRFWNRFPQIPTFSRPAAV